MAACRKPLKRDVLAERGNMLESDSKWYARIQALAAISEALEARLHR